MNICTPDKPCCCPTKYNYQTNLEMCERLFLVNPGKFPTAEELQLLPPREARGIMHRLNKIFQGSAEERHKKLTGKTMAKAAVDRMGDLLKMLMH